MTNADLRQERLRRRPPRRRTTIYQSALVPKRFGRTAKQCAFRISVIARIIPVVLRGLLIVLAFDTNGSRPTTTARAQQDPTRNRGGDGDGDACACSPTIYTFRLDFSLTCPPTNTDIASGVASISCLISPFGAPTNNLVPVVVESVGILELDQVNNVLVEERIDREFFDGDSFKYSSVIKNLGDVTSVEKIPKALQLNLRGRNKNGVMLMNVFIVTFTNECGVSPIIHMGESVGWAIFSQVTDPMPGICPTKMPSSSPSRKPSRRPSTTPPTRRPTSERTTFPSMSPTERPTDEPTLMETGRPTGPPTEIPTILPSAPSTTRATHESTPFPIKLPTERPREPTFERTHRPTRKQSRSPTLFPNQKPSGDSTSHPTLGMTEMPATTEAPTKKIPVESIDGSIKPTRTLTDQSSKEPTEKPPHTRLPTNKPTSPQTKDTMLPTGSPSRSSIPTQLSAPSVFDATMSMSMSMSMSLSISSDFKFSQLMEAELESMEHYFHN